MQGRSLALLHLSKVGPSRMAGGGTCFLSDSGAHSSLHPGQGVPPGRQGSEAVLVGRLLVWQPQAIPRAMMMMFARDSSGYGGVGGPSGHPVTDDPPGAGGRPPGQGCRTAGVRGTLGKRPGWGTGLAQRDRLLELGPFRKFGLC